MRYILVDWIEGGDCFTEEFSTKEEAIKEAEYQWHVMTEYDKERRSDFYIVAADVGEEGEQFKEDIILNFID